ncbi:MAG: SulP family inorganic anion transporter [Exilibacterium sp.]
MFSPRKYTTNLHGDIFGGITAAIVALPLALAFGISSGAGPVAGLYGAIIVGFFAAVFGGTPSQISGPTGPMTVVMTAMITEFAAQYPDQGLTLAFSTVFLGGCLQVALGGLRLGKYIVMVPYPVISGFMTGIGAIIILLELGPLLGFSPGGNIIDAVGQLPSQVANYDSHALLIGSLTLAIIFLWRGRAARVVPPPLLALIVATLTIELLYPDSPIERIGAIPSALPSLQLPTLEFGLLQKMLTNALMLAVLGSIDSLLTSLVADNVTGTQHRSDRELIGQGIGNAVSGLVGGLPGAGATMRTMVNVRAGGRGPLSGITHALVLLAIVAGMGFLFENIPLAALAGILIKVGIDIIDWPFIKRLHRLPLFPVALMVIVFLLTVFVDLITAVFVGVFIKNMVTISKLSDLQLGSVILSDGTQEIERLPEDERRVLTQHAGEAVLFRITGPISYAVGRGLTTRFEQFKNRKLLLIDIADAAIIGISTAMVLEELIRSALAKGTEVKLIGAHADSHHELQQLGLVDLVGKENCSESVAQVFPPQALSSG